MKISLYSPEECEKIALLAELRYVHDSSSWIIRKKSGKGFVYLHSDGTKLTNQKDLTRVSGLAIPPAFPIVWICPHANGHIQATWRDSKNRKQYLYHPYWQEARQKQKFDSMISFGQSIAIIRKHINRVLNQEPTLSKKQIICAILYLLDNSCIRIGNSIYAEENKTYGLTTLRKKHLSIKRNKATFDFEGKNSKVWHINIENKKVVKLLKKCEEIPGYELFKYKDQNKVINTINSQDINMYLQKLTSYPFTAKDFRTWIASRELLFRLIQKSEESSQSKFLKTAFQEVADLLGHTPSICKKSYVQPDIIRCFQNGQLEQWKRKNQRKIAKLDKDKLLLLWLNSVLPSSI